MNWFGWVATGVTMALLSWGLLVTLASRLPAGTLKDLVALLPACATTTRTLRADPRAPRRDQLADFLPVIGPLDDVVVVALAFRYAARRIPGSLLLEAWPADPAVIERLLGPPPPGWPSPR